MVIYPKNLKIEEGLRGSNRHFTYSDQPTAQETHCREAWFTSRRAMEFPNPDKPFYTTYGFGTTASKLPNIRIFSYSWCGKIGKNDQPAAQGYIAQCFRILHVVAEGPKGCLL